MHSLPSARLVYDGWRSNLLHPKQLSKHKSLYINCHSTTGEKKLSHSSNLTHIASLGCVLNGKQQEEDSQPMARIRQDGGGLFDRFEFNLPSIFSDDHKKMKKSTATEEMSPRSLTDLQQLLLSGSPKLSPKSSISQRWRDLHGSDNWSGLLDPLDSDLRRELVRYGEHVQATYSTFFSDPSNSGSTDPTVVLPDNSYRVTAHLYATSSIEMPTWLNDRAPWLSQRSSWIGYVAVCDDDKEIQRMGRRDIVIALRGTATCLEWAENLRHMLVDIDKYNTSSRDNALTQVRPRVECGFQALFKTRPHSGKSLAESVVEEVQRLIDTYEGKDLSITVTGHSLGAALAILVADELSTCRPHVPPVTVFSFGGPRVGNRGFVDRVEDRGVKVLRVVNKQDLVTRVPGVLLAEAELTMLESWTYSHVGKELRLDSRDSPFLKSDADLSCCHDLEAYLHLVDGFLGSHCPFRSNAKRSIVKLMSHQGSNMKKVYVSGSETNRLKCCGIILDLWRKLRKMTNFQRTISDQKLFY